MATELQDLGVKVLSGAHGQREGLAQHWEIWMMAQGGMTPLEALRTSTIDPATVFGMDHALGSLEEGKLADIIVIDGDPLKNIRDTDKVTHTMVNGVLYDAAAVSETTCRNQRCPASCCKSGDQIMVSVSPGISNGGAFITSWSSSL